MQFVILGIKMEVIGTPAPDVGMYIINHRSWMDIFAMEAVLDKTVPNIDICWIGHSKLTKNPIVNALFKLYGNITVERDSKAGMIKLLRTVEKPIKNKRPLMIFPEGTRNKQAGIGKFKQGAKMIAERNNLKVQPVVLIKTDWLFDTKHMKTRTGVLKIIFMDPVDIKEENWLEKTHNKMLLLYNQH